MKALITTLNDISQPDPHYFPDKLERQHQFERNRAFIIMLVIILVFCIFHLYWQTRPLSIAPYAYVLLILSVIIVFCLTRRLNPHIFKVFYALGLSCVGPICIYLDKDGVFGGWITVHLSPLFLLFFSDSYLLYFIQVGVQVVLLEVLYKDEMMRNADSRLTDDYIERLISVTTYVVAAESVIVYNIHRLLDKGYRQELMYQEVKRKELEVQKTFILSFSHEIRNLINILIGNVQLSLLEKLTPKTKSYMEDAEIGASLLLQLINNILDTGNMDVGEFDMNPVTKVTHNTLEKVWGMCAHVFKVKRLRGQLRISKNLPKNLKLDHDRLVQIIINLIANAVKFTQQGSVTIKIEWVQGHAKVADESFLPSPFDDENEGLFEKDLAVSVLCDEFINVGIDRGKWSAKEYKTTQESGPGILKVSVTDTGYGILPENLPYVFDRFSAHVFGDSSTNRLGTTIGLYVTKELCNRMKGDIKVFSKVNRGTTFIVCLPAEQVMDEPNPIGASAASEHKLRAMIVDDHNFNIVVLTNYLQRMQIDIADTAGDGSEAYNKYVQSVTSGNPFDIVTMDVEMPIMDGKQAARKIREYERQNDLKPCFMIMISGNVCESEISQCLRHEGRELANLFMKKPATYDDLCRVISQQFPLPTSRSNPS